MFVRVCYVKEGFGQNEAVRRWNASPGRTLKCFFEPSLARSGAEEQPSPTFSARLPALNSWNLIVPPGPR